MLKSFIVTALMAASMISVATAQTSDPLAPSEPIQFPFLNVEEACKGYDEGVTIRKNECMDKEQINYNVAKKGWRMLNWKEQRACIITAQEGTASFNGAFFYTFLRKCMDGAIIKAEIAGRYPRQFRY